MSLTYTNDSAYECCPSCGGHGHVFDGLKSEPDWCRECGSSGHVRARDKRGRFLGRVDPIWDAFVGLECVRALETELPKLLPDLSREDIARIEESF